MWLIGRREALGRKERGEPLVLRLRPTLLPPCLVGSKTVKGYLRGVTLDFSTLLTGSCGSHLIRLMDAVPSDRHVSCLPADGPRLVIESVFLHHIATALPVKRQRRKARRAFSRATVAVQNVSWCKVRCPIGRLHPCYLVAMLLRHGTIRNSDVASSPLVSFHEILLP